jgi:uncharacterized protein
MNGFSRAFSLRALVLAGAVALAGAAFAQQGAPRAPQPPPTNLPASHVEIASEVLRTSGLMRTFEASTPNVVQMLRANMSRTRPELVKQIEESLKVVEGRMAQMTADGLKGAAGYLAARMTEAELKEVNTFLVSPVGKKYVETLPAFMEDMLPYLEQWTQVVGQEAMTLFRAEMAKRGAPL